MLQNLRTKKIYAMVSHFMLFSFLFVCLFLIKCVRALKHTLVERLSSQNRFRNLKKKVKITVKNNKIILYNDGENIDEKLLNNIFTPYEKGVNGVFGLGLSIVKKTLHFLNYDISIENVKNGVKFTIY